MRSMTSKNDKQSTYTTHSFLSEHRPCVRRCTGGHSDTEQTTRPAGLALVQETEQPDTQERHPDARVLGSGRETNAIVCQFPPARWLKTMQMYHHAILEVRPRPRSHWVKTKVSAGPGGEPPPAFSSAQGLPMFLGSWPLPGLAPASLPSSRLRCPAPPS